MIHKWASKSGGTLISNLWTTQALKVALLKSTFIPDFDTQAVWADVSAHEITGPGYSAGGAALTGRSASYDASSDRMNLLAADTSWGPGATFQAYYAIVYDSASGAIWSYVDFQGVKDVTDGVFTIDWATIGLLYTVPL